MIIAHSWFPPAIYKSLQDGKTYMICDGKYIEVPEGTTWFDIKWFKRPDRGSKNEAFKIQIDWEVDGSKGKKYTVAVDDDKWSCSCPAFGWSGNRRTCKHIEKIKKEEFGL
jgi:hypothetical protein